MPTRMTRAPRSKLSSSIVSATAWSCGPGRSTKSARRARVAAAITRANLPPLSVGGSENRARVVAVLAAVPALQPGLSLVDLFRPAVQPEPAPQLLLHSG